MCATFTEGVLLTTCAFAGLGGEVKIARSGFVKKTARVVPFASRRIRAGGTVVTKIALAIAGVKKENVFVTMAILGKTVKIIGCWVFVLE
jgi:hypothetical protein